MSCLDRIYENVELYDADLEDYQREAVSFLRAREKAALFLDTGLGKTAICLRLIRDLLDDDEVQNVLIVAPLKVVNQTWGFEIEKWHFSAPIPYKIIRDDAIVEAALVKEREAKKRPFDDADYKKIQRAVRKKVREFKRRNPDCSQQVLETLANELLPKETEKYRKYIVKQANYAEAKIQIELYNKRKPTIIHLINHETLTWLINSCEKEWIYDTIIFDESDAIKDARTERWQALDRISHKIKRFYQLTGTPVAENYEGLFAQIKLLDGGKRLGMTMTEYLSRYFDVNKYNYKKTLRAGAEEAITKAISDICLVMKQEDYLKDVPPYVVENVLYELPNDILELYQMMFKSGVVRLPCGKQIVALQAASVIQKMMQIAAGFIYDSEETMNDFGSIKVDRTIYQLHDAKIEALKKLMAQYPDDNFLISYYHQGSLEKLLKHFPNAVKMDKKGTQKEAWNKGKIKMLLMHPKSGAHGLNLQQGGRIVINYDVFFSYGQFYQFLRRLARRGQRGEKVLVFNLLASGTYDLQVEKGCWREKKHRQDVFFELLKSLKYKGKKKQ